MFSNHFKKFAALLLAALFLVGVMPAALAENTAYWVSLTSSADAYRSGNTNAKVEVSLSIGDMVMVRDGVANNGFYQCAVNGADTASGSSNVYIPTSAFPNFTAAGYTATINAETKLYNHYTNTTQYKMTLKSGDKVTVITSSVSNYYFVRYTDGQYNFCGYVPQSVCTASGAVAATPDPTASLYKDGEFSAYGQVATTAILYEGPSKNTKVLGQFSTGGTIGIMAQTGTTTEATMGFYYVSVKNGNSNMTGFVECNAVFVSDVYAGKIPTDVNLAAKQYAADAGGSAGTAGAATIANCSSWVSMRKSASSSAKRVAKVKLGASVTVLGTDGKYTKVKYNNTEGYILSTYVKTK